MCASLLNKGKTTLRRVPRIEEVFRIVETLKSIGVKIDWSNGTMVIETPDQYNLENINLESANKTRSIVMFIGPLINYLNNFSLPQSGGCKLGSRTVKPHFYALENFGVDIKVTETAYQIEVDRIKPTKEIILYESGDTVTENTLMAAALTPGETTIKYASANYMVQELCFFLLNCGVKIDGIGTSTLRVSGVSEINQDIDCTLSEDPTDSMFFLTAAILTNSSIVIKRCPIEFLELELLKLSKMGFQYQTSDPYFCLLYTSPSPPRPY